MEKLSIIGAGSWGSALARIIADNNHEVLLFDNDSAIVNEINHYHTNTRKLSVGYLPDLVRATTNLEELLDFSDVIIISIPTKVIRSVIQAVAQLIKKPKLFVNTSKGMEPGGFKRVSEIVYEEIPTEFVRGFVALTGPSHAEEVINQMPTTICSVSNNRKDALFIQQIFSNRTYFRVYTGRDLIGSELCGAIKNIYAIASGMLHGLKYGDNARAGMITRALVEMRRIINHLGGLDETVFGLTGLGDLVVTTTSYHSRNFQAGVKLATGSDLQETISSISMTVEGVRTTEAAYLYSKENNLDTPIIDSVYRVIYEKQDVHQAVSELMMRSLKDE